MKGRESGMPDEAYWASFFDPHAMLDRLLVPYDSTHGVLEFGCGYGTFTLPAASRTRGQVTALDIEPSMVSLVAQRARTQAWRMSRPRFVTSSTMARGCPIARRGMSWSSICCISKTHWHC